MRILSPVFFGPFSISFICPSLSIIKYLKRFFSGYECEHAPDVTINILPTDQMLPSILKTGAISTKLAINKEEFEISNGLIRGRLNLNQKECNISVHNNFFDLPLVNVFQFFLYLLYHTLCLEHSIRSYFIHGCGVIKKGQGYLFIGPHGSGKTTIGKLSGGMILHDDQVILTVQGKDITMDSPPLPGKHRFHAPTPSPVERVFSIIQDSDVLIKRMSAQLALQKLYNEIVVPLTLSSLEEKNARLRKAEICFDVLKSLPLYELYFDKKGNFWDLLTNIRSS
jgi:hypothetical protein